MTEQRKKQQTGPTNPQVNQPGENEGEDRR